MFAGGAFARRPLTCQSTDEFAIFELWFLVAPPCRAATDLRRLERRLSKARKICAPAFVDRIGIFEILRIKRLDEYSVRPKQKRGRFEQIVRTAAEPVWRCLICHFKGLWQDLLGLALSSCGMVPKVLRVAPNEPRFNAAQC